MAANAALLTVPAVQCAGNALAAYDAEQLARMPIERDGDDVDLVAFGHEIVAQWTTTVAMEWLFDLMHSLIPTPPHNSTLNLFERHTIQDLLLLFYCWENVEREMVIFLVLKSRRNH